MNRLWLSLIILLISIRAFSQSSDIMTYKHDYIVGAWYDSTKVSTGGSGFIFSSDSCCSLIIDGEMTECINESKKIKVLYSINFNSNPKQIDINFVDLKTSSIKKSIQMIFEIIDINHIRLAVNKDFNDKRPCSFDANSNYDISTLTRYFENKKN